MFLMSMNRVSVILIATWILVSCQSSPDQDLSQKGGYPDLRIALRDDPNSLDPRLTMGLYSCAVVQRMQEGLFRQRENGDLEPALAKTVDVSEDGCTYTFHLREACWSDGKPVVAQDFTKSWLETLSPSFPSRYSDMFYPVKNAKEAKVGTCPPEQVGVRALDSKTLEVRLQYPAPYFLGLTAKTWLAPVPSHLLSKEESWHGMKPEEYPSCGPFRLMERSSRGITVVKNPRYWDADSAKIQRMDLLHIPDENTASEMLLLGEVDYVGLPFGQLTQELALDLASKGQTLDLGMSTHFLTVNMERPPLDHPKIRRALCLAIDRPKLAEFIFQRGARPLMSVLTPDLALQEEGYFPAFDPEEAKRLLGEALEDLGCQVSDLPPISLIYNHGDCNHQYLQQIQEDWRRVLGVEIHLEVQDFPTVMSRWATFDLDLCRNALIPPFDDPVAYLERFRGDQETLRFTRWVDENYTRLIEDSNLERNPSKRKDLLHRAERLLMDQTVFFPVVAAFYQGAVAAGLDIEGLERAGTGHLDFKYVQVLRRKSGD